MRKRIHSSSPQEAELQAGAYRHVPIDGLPVSLLRGNSRTPPVITLMQRMAGLNRELRRAVSDDVARHMRSRPLIDSSVPKSDVNALGCYLDPSYRFVYFWHVATKLTATPPSRPGRLAYALALDYQLLKSFDPDFFLLTLNADELVQSCTEWPRILEGMEKVNSFTSRLAPVGVFMLWPRIAADLRRWNELDVNQRLKLGHAVFSLSSIGFTDWFVRQALSICQPLGSDLGHLLQLNPDLQVREGAPKVLEAIQADSSNTCHDEASIPKEGGSPRLPAINEDWDALLFRLDALTLELRSNPNREAVADLSTLAEELERLCVHMPVRPRTMCDQFEGRRLLLLEHLKSLGSRVGFEWLDAELIAQIDARWRLAIVARTDHESIEELTRDAAAAITRSETAADAFTQASVLEGEGRRATDRAGEALSIARGFGEQAAARRRQAEARQSQLDAESAKLATQERLVDAASPFEEPFDYSRDYFGAVSDVHEAPSSTAPFSPTNKTDIQPYVTETLNAAAKSTSAESELLRSTKDGERGAELIGPIQSAAEASVVVEQTQLSEGIPAPSLTSAPSSEQALITGEDKYSESAGESCRPIWRMLSLGQPALAFHAAQWIDAVHPGTKVPPIDLLAATAFAQHLMLPDGPVQAALGARFSSLSPEDYTSDSPRSWHAAVNLLLVAATLRPMVLVPGTGAASVVGYLHHDGHYPALYNLVQELRELSTKLVGFRIDPTALRQARGEAAIRTELQGLQVEAADWLRSQAPNFTIKFAAATSVWRQWLRPGGEIETVVAPVVHNRSADARRVRDLVEALSDPEEVSRRIRHTDRKVLERRKGEEIHSGARDHLLRNVEEALRWPRQWLALIELLGDHGDRLRALLERVNDVLRKERSAVEQELLRTPNHDPWGLVFGGQQQVLLALRGLIGLFDADAKMPEVEPSPSEVLGRPLLLLPELQVDESWAMEMGPDAALSAVARMEIGPPKADVALRERLHRGDLLGAELMVEAGFVEAPPTLRQERDRWKQTVRRELAECRRTVEVGSAYGYVLDGDRRQIEGDLARWEAQLEEMRRFDVVMTQLEAIRDRLTDARDRRVEEVRNAMRDIVLTEAMQPAVADLEKALADGDIATANELVHWLKQGRPNPTDLDDESSQGFDAFFPRAMQTIENWLEGDGKRRDVVERTLRQGNAIPGLEAVRIDGAQRDQSAKLFSVWSDMKSAQQVGDQHRLSMLLHGLGWTVKDLHRAERVPGREVWTMDAAPIDDRHLCALPLYGSSAGGRYRVICVWGRPTEDDLLQWVGDSSVNRPALMLYFGRMSERKWRELSRLAKTKRRTLVLLDETLLVYLCTTMGSRLRTLFDVALPFSYSSPYDATAGLVPPEMFYGRGAELDAVRGVNGRCFIYGGRQLGKTALLKRAEQSFHAPGRGHYARWIDLRAEGIGVSLEVGEIWVTLHEKLKELHVLDPKLAAPAPGKKQGPDAVVRAISDFLNANSDRRVLLLLDEADRFFEQDSRNDFRETRRLKQLMDDTQRRFKVVFAGLHNVLRMTELANHPLAHLGEPIEIGPLREGEDIREAAALIRRPMGAAGFAFESKHLVIRILAQTNYYPSLIQLYCSHLLRHMLGQVVGAARAIGPRYVVTDRDIEQVYSSESLRDEIRAKFRLTLQLDPRYEVLAYAMALDLLRNAPSQTDGMPWQTIRQTCALYWWADGFRDTSEADFQVLLNEMVGLGVLARLSAGRYVLRNSNVLLLLGTQEEIEAVLAKDREPSVEFEMTTFRPPLRRSPNSNVRNVFTYQQLSQLLQRPDHVTVVTGARAAGVDSIASSLDDYLSNAVAPIVPPTVADRKGFGNALQAALADRPKDQMTVFVVPESVPWTDLWLDEADQRVKRLRRNAKLASVVFVAEPATLWRLVRDEGASYERELPWMSLLPWNEEFLRQWLDERQLQLDPEDRGRLIAATGLWPALIQDIAGDCTEVRALRERINRADQRWFADADQTRHWRVAFGLDVSEPTQVLDVLMQLNEPVEVRDLAHIADMTTDRVNKSLRWGELLGLTRRQDADFWMVDPIVVKVLASASL